MLKAFGILFFLLRKSSAKTVDVAENPRVLIEKNIKIDFSTCDHDFYVYEDYKDKDNEEGCHRIHMPEDTIQSKYGESVNTCCSLHGYLTIGNCDGKDDKGTKFSVSNVQVCQDAKDAEFDPERTNRFEKTSLNCPENCNLIKNRDFEKDPGAWKNGTLSLKGINAKDKIKDKKIHSFCLGYGCSQESGSWITTYEACVCSDKTVEAQNLGLKTAHPHSTLCCGLKGTLDEKDQNCYEDGKIMDPIKTESKGAYQCNWKSKAEFKVVRENDLEKDTATCISVITNAKETFTGGVICDKACGGKEKCFQACNEKGKGWSQNDYMDRDRNISFTDIIGIPVDETEDRGNIEYSIEGEIPCQKVDKNYMSQQIYPEDNCHNRAEFKANGDLVLPERDITLHYKEFCIAPTTKSCSKGRYMIQACLPKKEMKTKFSFYFIILSVSITCLIFTVLVYLIFHKALLRSSYNKIMVNFAISLLLAFLILVVNQNHGSEFSKICCTILGHFNQFFFLATFTWMTIMSYEIFKQIHGMSHMIGGHNSNSILKQIFVGYGVPLIIVLVTVIVELTADKCASYNPRFGHKSCLFFGKLDKFLWLYGPILVMLVINTIMFIYITVNVVQNQKTGAADSMKTGTRKEKLDKICLYLRLFLGMGVIWYFELLSFALSTGKGQDEWAYFTDCLNMLQGVWVFITFVCKRNVLKVITRRTDKLYSGILRTKSSLNPQPEKANYSQTTKTEEISLTSMNT